MARGEREGEGGCHWFPHHLCFALVQLCVCASLSLFLSLASVCECHSVCCVPFKKFSFILSLLVFFFSSSSFSLSRLVICFLLRPSTMRLVYLLTIQLTLPAPAAALHLHLLLAFIIMLQSTFFLSPFLRHNFSCFSVVSQFVSQFEVFPSFLHLFRSSLHSLPPKSCQPLVL